MKELSYNLSQTVNDYIKRIETLRKEILLTPLSPKTELQLRWEANCSRIFFSLKLAGEELTRDKVQKVLMSYSQKPDAEGKLILKYKKSFDYIQQNWLVNHRNVTSNDLMTLYHLAHSGKFRVPETEIKRFLEYLQVHPEHPVIQAAVAQAQIVADSFFVHHNGTTARLFAYLLLYKAGYDFRGLLVLEEVWAKEAEIFHQTLKRAIENGNLTLWIEFFSQSAIASLEKARIMITADNTTPKLSSNDFWNLNERQKSILSLLETPGVSLTNKTVQQNFKVSQITASRDLAKLAKLGLIFSHGKGRSVYYTKV